MRNLCDGHVPRQESPLGGSDLGVVYCCFNHVGHYVGKTVVHRLREPGYPMRVWEHWKATSYPATAEGMKPRYRIFRSSFGSMCMLPLLTAPTEARAFALEAVAIRMEAPMGNALDMKETEHGRQKVKFKGGIRHHPRVRQTGTRIGSIWALPLVLAHLTSGDARQRFPLLVGSAAADAPFKQLYTLRTIEQYGRTGSYGPLWPWHKADANLLVSLCAGRMPDLPMPRKWFRWELCAYLYYCAQVADIIIKVPSRKLNAHINLAKLLRRLGAPLYVPIIKVPPLFKTLQLKGAFRKCVYRALEAIRCWPVRFWILTHLRVTVCKTPVWKDHQNGNGQFRTGDVPCTHVAGAPLPCAVATTSRL